MAPPPHRTFDGR